MQTPNLTFAWTQSNLLFTGQVKDGSDSVFEAVLKAAPKDRPTVGIDLGGLVSMSFIGAAAWVAFLGDLKRGSKITLSNCPVFFVDYLNMFDAFVSGVTVASIEVPYACPTCGFQDSTFMKVAGLSADLPFPTRDCPQCGGVMDSIVNAQDYLVFLGAKHHP